MLHLLQVSQHTVTREELKEDISQTDRKIDKLEINLNEKIDKLDKKIDKVEANLGARIDNIDNKMDRMLWFMVVLFFTIIIKDFLLK
jgi:peptidoglycan hydrolase CwlO-like protein